MTPAGILAARLGALRDRLDVGAVIDRSLVAEVSEACELAQGLDPYLGAMTTPASPALQRLDARTRAADWRTQADENGPALEQEMLSGHVEGQLLKMLVHATGASTVLEIGMFTGYSALAMAEALPVGGRLVACEIDAGAAALAQSCFDASPDGGKIEVWLGPALNTLAELATAGEAFDFIFIDADKANYPGYLSTVVDSTLLTEDGLICVDNTLMQGEPWMPDGTSANGAAIAAFNESVAADPRVEQVLIPLRDGVTLIRRAPTTGGNV